MVGIKGRVMVRLRERVAGGVRVSIGVSQGERAQCAGESGVGGEG